MGLENLNNQTIANSLQTVFLKSVDPTNHTITLCCPECSKRYGVLITTVIKVTSKGAAKKFDAFQKIHAPCASKAIDTLIARAFDSALPKQDCPW